MALSLAMRAMLKALSGDEVEVESSRHFADIKAKDPLRKLRNSIDYTINAEGRDIPTRIYFPEDFVIFSETYEQKGVPALLFFHGGGWVADNIDNYDVTCMRLANETSTPVISVDYRLAPEYRFPSGLEDCYEAAECLFRNKFLFKINTEKTTLIGDSAGGNLAAALSLLCRDRGEFMPKKQILIYPATDTDHSENSRYPSVTENGSGYLLTAQKVEQFIELYSRSPEDYENPYFAPMKAKDLSNQPETLVITAEYDPLRDEGEAYAARLKEAGTSVETHRIDDAIHGFFGLGLSFSAVKETLEYIGEFIK